MQSELPVVALYLPATHAEHGPPFGPVEPVAQTQSSSVSLPAGEDCPAGHAVQVSAVAAIVVEYLPSVQSVHEPEPVTDLYFPATQAVHALPVYPVLH